MKPMLLKTIEKPFDSKDYLFELKYDGIRALLYVNDNQIKIESRNGKDITTSFKEIKVKAKGKVVFDGEIVVFKNGKPSFNDVIKKLHGNTLDIPIYIVFDILYQNEYLTMYPLIKRKEILNKYMDTQTFKKSFYVLEKGKKFFKNVQKLELEGMVAKKLTSVYEEGKRSDNWLKIKNIQSDDFSIGGYIINSDSLSLLLGEKKKNSLIYVGKVKTNNQELFKKLKKFSINKNPFANYNKEGVFVNPFYTARVKFLEKGKKGLRHPTLETYF